MASKLNTWSESFGERVSAFDPEDEMCDELLDDLSAKAMFQR